MISHPAVPACVNRLHSTNIDKERDELPCARGELTYSWQGRIVGKQLRVMNTDHPSTRARRGHDMIITGKCVHHLQGDCLRVGAVSRVVCGLPTTSLSTRHVDGAACGLKQPDRGKTYSRPKKIYQTGYK